MTQRQIPVGQALPFDGQTSKIIDTPAVLSNYNHRLYRQGYIYRAKVNIAIDDPNTYVIYAIKNTWMSRNAYNKAHEAYLNNTKEERAVLGKNMIARWNDFRVEDGYNNLLPLEGTSLLVNSDGEYASSQVTDEAGNQFEFSWADGSSAGTKLHIMAEYDKMANTPKTPEGPAASVAYGGIDDDVSFATASDLQQHGDEPPYSADNIQTANFRYVATLSASGSNSQLSTGYFDVPCGLILVTGLSTTSKPIVVEAQAGKYKGVHAERMGSAKLVNGRYEVR